jgi:aromatic ring hydroxylase
MTARTGQQYLEGLRDDRAVWLGARKVSVLDEPAFAGSLKGAAGYFDWQHRYAEDCLVEDAESGGRMSCSLILPKTHEDLRRRHRGLERLARYSYGMLGRTPDYVNVALSGHIARADIIGKNDPKMAERHRRFYREVVEGDLSLTHSILHAHIDKSIGDLAGANADLTLRVVKRSRDSITVRGAKLLATLAPFADELYVYPSAPVGKGDEAYALSFSIPLATKGLLTFCRDHYGFDANVADAPFSSRFDEQDAWLIFDDVEVPIERVFIDGDLEAYNSVSPAVSPGNVLQQTSIRAMVKLQFAYDLCAAMAKATNSDKKPEIAQMLGEIYSYLMLTRSTIYAAEARAFDWGNGAFFCHGDLRAVASLMPGWMVRVNDIIKQLGSHNLLATPSLAAFDDPEVGGLLEKYLPGAGGMSARERAKIFRTAWDFAGSALGGRVELYERFYLTSQARNLQRQHMAAQKEEEWTLLGEFLGSAGVN